MIYIYIYKLNMLNRGESIIMAIIIIIISWAWTLYTKLFPLF